MDNANYSVVAPKLIVYSAPDSNFRITCVPYLELYENHENTLEAFGPPDS